MHYDVKFPTKSIANKFRKKLEKVSPPDAQQKIMEKVEALSSNPRPFGRKLFKHIKPPVHVYRYIARYRIRVSSYRVLYDIDDNRKIVWIYSLRKREEDTYK